MGGGNISLDVKSVCFLLGLVAGIIVVLDLRIHKGMSDNAIMSGVGLLLGAILAWTCIDVIHVMQNPEELTHVEHHKDKIEPKMKTKEEPTHD